MSALFSLGVSSESSLSLVGEATVLYFCGGSLVGYNIETSEQTYIGQVDTMTVQAEGQSVTVSPDRSVFVYGNGVYDGLSLKLKRTFPSQCLLSRTVSPNNRMLLTLDQSGLVVHSMLSGRELARLDSNWKVSTGTVGLWMSNDMVMIWVGKGQNVRYVKVDNNGRMLKYHQLGSGSQTRSNRQTADSHGSEDSVSLSETGSILVQKNSGNVYTHSGGLFSNIGKLHSYPAATVIFGGSQSEQSLVVSTEKNICVYVVSTSDNSLSLCRVISAAPLRSMVLWSSLNQDTLIYLTRPGCQLRRLPLDGESQDTSLVTEFIDNTKPILSASFSQTNTNKPVCLLTTSQQLSVYALTPTRVHHVHSIDAFREDELLQGGFTCAALHPSGYLILAALQSASSLQSGGKSTVQTELRMYAVTVEGIVEVARHKCDHPITQIRFSHKGDLIALAGHTLSLYHTENLVLIGTHADVENVTDVCFDAQDTVVVAASLSSMWELKCATMKMLNQYVLSGETDWLKLGSVGDSDWLYCADRHTIYRFGHGHKPVAVLSVGEVEDGVIESFEVVSGQLTGRFLVTLKHGDSCSRIRLLTDKTDISDPLLTTVSGVQLPKVTASAWGVSAVCSGHVCHFFRTEVGRGQTAPEDSVGQILISRQTLTSLESEIASLQLRLQHMRTDLQLQMTAVEQRSCEERLALEDRMASEIASEQDTVARLTLSLEEKKTSEVATLQAAQGKAMAAVSQVETDFQRKYRREVERCEKLTETMDKERQEFAEAVSGMHGNFESRKCELRSNHEAEISGLRREREVLLAVAGVTGESGGEIEELERRLDERVDAMKQEYEQLLMAEKDEKIRLRGQSGIHRKFHEDLKRVNSKKDGELQSWLRELESRRDKIANSNKDIEGLVKELKEREKSIVDKDASIAQFRRDQSELEKFKYVLDYKVKELKRIMEPKNKLISDLHGEVKEIEKELDQVTIGNRELERGIDELDSRGRCLHAEILVAKKELRRWRGLASELRRDIQSSQTSDKKHLVSLHNKWILKTPVATTTVSESDRMREYLENSIMTLKQQLLRSAETFRQDSLRLKGEQAQLLGELNSLREEVLFLTNEKLREEMQLRELKEATKLRRLEMST